MFMSKMKLTIDARLVNSSGIGVYIQNVLKNERLKNYKLKLLFKEVEKDFFKEISDYAEMVTYNAPLYSIDELLNTPAKTLDSDIFWSPHFNVPVVNFAKKLKVVTIHDVFHLAHYGTLSRGQKLYAKWMYKKAVNASDVIFTVSETSKVEIIKYTGAKAEKIKVVHNGIDFVKFNTVVNIEERAKILKQYKIDFPFVLFVGNVKPHKNLHHALLGFKEYLLNISSADQQIKFVIVGKRDGFITGDTNINSLVSDPVLKDKVHFTGWVRHGDLPALYQSAAAFVFPSFYEGFGFPPLEAMAAGCPVISSNASCMPEIYGDAALFFKPDDKNAIAIALKTILTNEQIRASLITKGLEQSKKYSWSSAVNAKLDWIEGV